MLRKGFNLVYTLSTRCELTLLNKLLGQYSDVRKAIAINILKVTEIIVLLILNNRSFSWRKSCNSQSVFTSIEIYGSNLQNAIDNIAKIIVSVMPVMSVSKKNDNSEGQQNTVWFMQFPNKESITH